MDVFPYAAGGSRRTDLDHTTPYLHPQRGGPPGQTAVGNLGPLVRYYHRTEDPRAVECPTTRTGHLGLADASTDAATRPQAAVVNHALGKVGLRPTDLARRQRPTNDDPSDPTEGSPLKRIVRAQIQAYTLTS